ncbi:hypothetical protein [uncultured Tateyamaria sp.]|uniref:hypothetical protein n=1 Tax=uncultured Tateyamaria sp. TaxID=455651 RepID=UPI002615E52F|nr:hypothetical protein [uncultured Tateyamaria sp.]
MTQHVLDQGPNVVSEDGFKQLLDEGYFAEVVCMQSAAKQYNTFSGNWIIRAVSPDGQIEKVLVTSRRDFKVREFKTTNGLLGFFDQFELNVQHIPWNKGVRVRIQLPKFEGSEPGNE